MQNNCTSIKNASTVTVRLKRFNSQKEVKTFTLQESCGQITFVTERIFKELHVTGVKTSINIKTLNGNQVSLTLVDGIIVTKHVLGARDQIIG